uniref:Uncharacterized protein n=1 Tax=Ureaplasma parvum TaxID=134821 RepID=Q0ZAT7_UREPR|nr:hypothetical protein UU149 [Ureaplasma parvum]
MEKIVSFIANLINTQKQFIKDLKELKNHKDIMVKDDEKLIQQFIKKKAS